MTCPFWLSLLFAFFFCHQVVHLIHLVFRWTGELNQRPRTMAQTVSPWRSPLDQGASLIKIYFFLFLCRKSVIILQWSTWWSSISDVTKFWNILWSPFPHSIPYSDSFGPLFPCFIRWNRKKNLGPHRIRVRDLVGLGKVRSGEVSLVFKSS